MVHTFCCMGRYFMLDAESGSVFETDELVNKTITEMNSPIGEPTGDFSRYTDAEITEAKAEINSLIEKGILFTAPVECAPPEYKGIIKAMCLNIAHGCNLKCGYCFAGDGTYDGVASNMSFEVASSAVDFLIEKSGSRKNLEIDFFGGEPLMNLGLVKQVVDYAKAEAAECGKAFKFTITTNGVLLTREISDYLNEEMDNVVLSLDGRKEINDRIRQTANGRGSFDLIKDNFLYFRSIRGEKNYFVRGTFTAENLDFSKDVLFLNDLGFDQISIEPVVLPDGNPLAIKKESVPGLFTEYEKLVAEYLKRRKTEKWFSFFHFNINLDNGPCLKKRMNGCGAGNEYFAVSPDGNIYPCHQFAGDKNYVLGNVFRDGYDEIASKGFNACAINSKPLCSGCWAKYHCGGGCNANAIHFNSDVSKPYETGCALMKKRLECALYVYAKEKEALN